MLFFAVTFFQCWIKKIAIITILSTRDLLSWSNVERSTLIYSIKQLHGRQSHCVICMPAKRRVFCTNISEKRYKVKDAMDTSEHQDGGSKFLSRVRMRVYDVALDNFIIFQAEFHETSIFYAKTQSFPTICIYSRAQATAGSCAGRCPTARRCRTKKTAASALWGTATGSWCRRRQRPSSTKSSIQVGKNCFFFGNRLPLNPFRLWRLSPTVVSRERKCVMLTILVI